MLKLPLIHYISSHGHAEGKNFYTNEYLTERDRQITLEHYELIRLTTSQKRLIEVTLTAKPYPLTSPCFGVAKTSLSFRKERDVAQRQGEVTFSPFAFLNCFQCSKSIEKEWQKIHRRKSE